MDLIDLAPLTLRFLARVQLLRESMQLYRSAPHLPDDTSYLSCASSWVGISNAYVAGSLPRDGVG